MDISEVAKRSGVAASALRYYEREGLLTTMARDGGRRRFTPAVFDQLSVIALGQAAGFSLQEIRAMFTPGGAVSIDRQMLARKADDLDRMAKRLRKMSETLRHAAVCPAPSHAECPSFQKLLKAAASGALEKAEKTLRPRRATTRAKDSSS